MQPPPLKPRSRLQIRPFEPQDQDSVKTLILEGLQDHWGSLDLSLNPDLNDIAHSYARATFLVGLVDGRLAACGALQPLDASQAQIVRMSVRRELRGQGLGGQMLAALMAAASAQGLQKIILETTASWGAVVAFYQAHGFRISHYLDGDVYLSREL